MKELMRELMRGLKREFKREPKRELKREREAGSWVTKVESGSMPINIHQKDPG